MTPKKKETSAANETPYKPLTTKACRDAAQELYKKRCSTCANFEPDAVDGDYISWEDGECHFNPPVARLQEKDHQGNYPAVWPHVDSWNWCSYWKQGIDWEKKAEECDREAEAAGLLSDAAVKYKQDGRKKKRADELRDQQDAEFWDKYYQRKAKEVV